MHPSMKLNPTHNPKFQLKIIKQHEKVAFFDRLLQDNEILWRQLQKYETAQELISEGQPQSSTYRIVEKIWDNKEDEFWDTF